MSKDKLKGKVAVITGGNSGIGLATAKTYLEQGAKVVVTARSSETYAKAKAELGAHFDVIQADVSKIEDLDKLFLAVKTKYKKIDILFANAGVALFQPTTDVDPEFFDNQFNTNVRGLYFTVAKALPLMNDGSSVILNASVVSGKGIAGASVYSATKAAVRSLARSWTAEIPVSKVRFNVLSPGPIETPIYGKMGMAPADVSAFGEQMKAQVPARRFGSAQEMANVALFLASDDSSYIAGADIMADGGFGQI
jgi:NAD(P)-dependent dehydrogenase (short-subunit alcohol dehydrogenase family)